MIGTSRSLSGEPTLQQARVAQVLWFGQTVGSTLVIAFFMLVMLPTLQIELPTLTLAPREVLVGAVFGLGAIALLSGRWLRNNLFSVGPQGLPADDPVAQAMARLNANSALVAGLLDAPFLIGVALYMVTQDPWVIYAGIWAPLVGGAMLWPDPTRACRQLMGP